MPSEGATAPKGDSKLLARFVDLVRAFVWQEAQSWDVQVEWSTDGIPVSNGGIASKVRGGLFNSAEHVVKFIARMYMDACIPNEHY
jgi:hypothetical protein